MTDFHIWGTVNQIGPRQFVVIVTGVCDDNDQTFLERGIYESREKALAAQMELIATTKARITESGGRVMGMECTK